MSRLYNDKVVRTIDSVKPTLGLEKTKEFKKKLEIKNRNKSSKDMFKKNFNKGGRVGLKRGTGLMKKKSNIQKIKETFGPGSSNPKKSAAKKKKFPDLTGDGRVTFADILKGRGVKRG